MAAGSTLINNLVFTPPRARPLSNLRVGGPRRSGAGPVAKGSKGAELAAGKGAGQE